MAHLLIAAAHKSSGKTTLAIGLCAAFRAQGLVVQPFKKGPDYIDPMWLSQASGRDCHNLDFYVTSNEEICAEFGRRSAGADISIIEGNKGLYDGVALDGSDSNAALAALLGAPVVLVVDTRGMTRGIAPLLLGYQAFEPKVRIAGVILNQIGGPRHEGKLRAVIEHYTDLPVVGAVAHDESLQIVERHLGLIPSNEHATAAARTRLIADVIAHRVDLAQLRAIATAAAPVAVPAGSSPAVPPPGPGEVRLGLVRDAAFGFYYPGDLEALQAAGAELVAIDALSDQVLPDVDGLFIGGGFPETFMHKLEANQSLRYSIRDAIEQGLPAYAECGGLMYLARSLSWKGKTCEMAGVIPADVIMHSKPQGRGYVKMRETGFGKWPLQTDAGEPAEFSAHEFHYSSLGTIDRDFQCAFAFEVLRGKGIDGRYDGIVYKNMLACYLHQRDVGRNHWAARFIEFIRGRSKRDAAGSRGVR